MPCGACGPTTNIGEQNMYKALEEKVLADEAARKEKEWERRVSIGLPVEEEKRGTLERLFGRRKSGAVA